MNFVDYIIAVFRDIFTVQGNENHIYLFDLPIVELLAPASIVGLLVGWYFSIHAKKETARSNLLQHMPIITLEIERRRKEAIKIKNIGSSAAIDVKIDNFYNLVYDDFVSKKKYIEKMKFDKSYLIQAGREVVATYKIKNSSGWGDDWTVFNLIHSKDNLVFNITYKDMSGLRYITRCLITEEEISVIKAPRILTFREKGKYFIFLCVEWVKINTLGRWNLIKLQRESQNDEKVRQRKKSK